MDLENQKRIKEFAEKFGGENLVVLFGAAEAEATGLAAETVMIGDREIDVLSGKNAGTYGCLFTKEKKETAADFVIDDIKKILDI